ncbi:fungal-specific transcription factor domain-containing protein [Xylariomycetidae sp. FL2044]|nr:fungal-specific transcription factor domain-containing protein [Xylariomycetidae sp. FL2044]
MPRGETVSPPSTTARGRQRPAVACDKCRLRKVRCDGRQPQCGVCKQADIPCETTQRAVRGPKKGYLKALRDRLVHLETLLESRHSAPQQQEELEEEQHDRDAGSNSDSSTLPVPAVGFADLAHYFPQPEVPPSTTATSTAASQCGIPLPSRAFLPDLGFLPDLSLGPSLDNSQCLQLNISSAVHAELDQLYFDRVHPSIPIIHQRRYLSWSKSTDKTTSRICLQYVMWALATLLSAQSRDMTEPFHQGAKQMLESYSPGGIDSASDIEMLQAWVLIATCESMRAQHRQAWLSAGRVFRLVQGLRLHQIDSPTTSCPSGDSESDIGTVPGSESDRHVEIEEKRRVFWMAYFLDHLLSLRNDWPVTLSEHVICTRLPSSDADFQGGRPVVGAFLSEAMAHATPNAPSAFNECIVLVTICGRSLLRGQQNTISKAYGAVDTSTSLEQDWWLDDMLTARLQVLSQFYPTPAGTDDPLQLFASILGQATTIYYCKVVLEAASSRGTSPGPNTKLQQYQKRALDAAGELVQLSKILADLHFSKIHPLMPIPLFVCAEFLYRNKSENETFIYQLGELMGTFRVLKNVNNHEQSYMDLLPQSCVSATIEMLRNTRAGDDIADTGW